MNSRIVWAVTGLILLHKAALAEEDGSRRSAPNVPQMVRMLATDQAVANATVMLVEIYRPVIASMFSSGDSRRCSSVSFVQTDASGRLPYGTSGQAAVVWAPGVAGQAGYLQAIQDGADYVMISQRLQSSRRSEQFGPGYATEAEAQAAREAYLRTPEGSNYTAFTSKRDGETDFRNYRMLQVKWVETARSARRFATEDAAKAARRDTVWLLSGAPDMTVLRQELGFCASDGVRVSGAALAAPLVDALERAPSPEVSGTESAKQLRWVIETWRKRIGG